MIWLAWAFLRAKLAGVVQFVAKCPLCAVCALLAIWGAYERHQAAKWHHRAEQCQMASQAAAKAQEALRAQERATYQEKAHEADQEYKAALADARDATSRYVATHRVIVSSGGQCAPVAVSEADPAGIRQELPAGAVVVSEADLRAAAEWQTYALDLRKWALSVTQ